MTRKGKIARLPRNVRGQLNRRLSDGEPGVQLVAWLNSLPEVQAVLAREFEGRAITEQNLSEWKQGGFLDWQTRQETLEQVRELAGDAAELTEATNGLLADHLSTVVSARYAAALAGWQGELTEDLRRNLRALRTLSQDIAEMRRGDHSAARIKLERDRLEQEREKSEAEIVEHFKRWAQNPTVRDWVCQVWVTPEEREQRLREIFGLEPKPETPGAAPPAQSESEQIRPNPTP
jgi:hypothetical protein